MCQVVESAGQEPTCASVQRSTSKTLIARTKNRSLTAMLSARCLAARLRAIRWPEGESVFFLWSDIRFQGPMIKRISVRPVNSMGQNHRLAGSFRRIFGIVIGLTLTGMTFAQKVSKLS
jgi:hypothetical protein